MENKINLNLIIRVLVSLLVFAPTLYIENRELYIIEHIDISMIFGPILNGFLIIIFMVVISQLFNLIELRYFLFIIIPLMALLFYLITVYLLESTFLSAFSMRSLLFFELGIFVFIILIDSFSFHKSKSIFQFTPTISGIIALSFVTFIYQFKVEMFDDKIKFDAIATIENNQEENRDCRIIFKKNGDYIQIVNYYDYLVSYCFYGTYELNSNVIKLTGDLSKELNFKKLKIVVEKNQKNPDDTLRLVQIDKNGEVIKGALKFNFKKSSYLFNILK
jgi:hypothetical protein